MSAIQKNMEAPGQHPDPVELLQTLQNFNKDQEKYNHLRTLFIEVADVDEYINFLDTDEDIELTRKQIKGLKEVLEGFKVYLKGYLEQTGERIGRFDEKLKKSGEEIVNPELTPEEVDKIAHTRKRVAKAMQIAKAPRGTKGKSLRDVAGKAGEAPTTKKLEDKTEAQYAEFIDGLSVTAEQKEKLLNITANYDEAVATAKELDENVRVPSKEQVIAHIMELGAEKLKKIATIMGKPGLVIETEQSFVEMKDAMNANQHYERQDKCYFASDYEWSGRPEKVSVSIIDMVQNPAVVPGQKPGKQRNDEQLRICEKYFRDNGMQLVSDRQYAAGMQQSLRASSWGEEKGEENPEKYILDFYGQPEETVTIFNQEHREEISQVASGFFGPSRRGVDFVWVDPADQLDGLGGRGAVQVI